MSWDGYITNLTAPDSDGSKMVEKAAIWGFGPPPSSWATSDGFAMKTEEIQKLASADQSVFASNGVHLGGTKFMLVKNELNDDSFACLQLRSSSVSATVGKTKQAFVIAVGHKDVAAGKVSQRVFGITKYLKDSGY